MARPGPTIARWYQRAVFYEVFLRGFADSSGDGCGDLRGLTERLDHLDWLGVDCLWLLPFYAVARCATAATTSATSSPSTPPTACWPTPSSWSTRPTSGACGSSPTWC